MGFVWVPLLLGLVLGGACGGGDDDDDDTIDAAASADAAEAADAADASATADATPADAPSATTCEDEYTDITGECDLFRQNCNVGYWCKVVSTPTAVATCVENGSGTLEKGDACTPGGEECRPGLICASGHCTPFCCPSTNFPCGSGTCDGYVWYGGPTYARICTY